MAGSSTVHRRRQQRIRAKACLLISHILVLVGLSPITTPAELRLVGIERDRARWRARLDGHGRGAPAAVPTYRSEVVDIADGGDGGRTRMSVPRRAATRGALTPAPPPLLRSACSAVGSRVASSRAAAAAAPDPGEVGDLAVADAAS